MRSLLDQPSRFLRVALPLLCFLYALSGIWRYEAGPLETVSTAAWAAFGVLVVATVAFGVAVLVRRTAKRG